MSKVYKRTCDGCARHYEREGAKYCSRACYQRHYAKHFNRNERCGQCPRKIVWKKIDGYPHPFNKDDGRDHFLDCSAVSMARKRTQLVIQNAKIAIQRAQIVIEHTSQVTA